MLIRSSEFDDFINSLIYELIYEHKIKFPKIVTLFLLIKEKGPVGRYKIVKELELPESITRGTLSYFKNLGIIHVTKKRCNINRYRHGYFIKNIRKNKN
jgi:predicted transcriptional regulator